jgi:hypothetical protein
MTYTRRNATATLVVLGLLVAALLATAALVLWFLVTALLGSITANGARAAQCCKG